MKTKALPKTTVSITAKPSMDDALSDVRKAIAKLMPSQQRRVLCAAFAMTQPSLVRVGDSGAGSSWTMEAVMT